MKVLIQLRARSELACEFYHARRTGVVICCLVVNRSRDTWRIHEHVPFSETVKPESRPSLSKQEAAS